jgi:acyl-CoA thioester hydrolase/thioesterase-3
MFNTAWYETEMPVRPDDIDMFKHVHSSRYLDFVLAARFDQMDRCYGNPIQDYFDQGLAWVVNECNIRYKRTLKLGDVMIVKTSLQEIRPTEVLVGFQILNKKTGKLCSDGQFVYTLINLNSQRAEKIPDWAIDRYRLKK